MHIGFWWENLWEINHWEDNVNASLRNRVGSVGVDWTDLATGRKKWLAPAYAVTKLRIVSNSGKFVASQELVDYQKLICSMEFVN